MYPASLMKIKDRDDSSMIKAGRTRASLIFLLLLFSYTFFFQIYPNFISTNELSRFLLTSAITDFHTLQIDQAIKRFGDSQDKATYKGHYYCDKAIGLSLMGVPVYAALTVIGAVFQINWTVKWILFFLKVFCVTIPTLLFTVVLSRFWYEIRADKRLIGMSVFLFLFGTILFTYSVQFVSNGVAGLFLFLSFYYIYQGKKAPETSAKYFLFGGMFSGCAILCEYPAILVVPVLAGYLLWITPRRIKLSWFLLGLLPFLLLLFAYNYSIFGTPFDVTYHHMSDTGHQQEHGQGFLGLRIPRIHVLYRILFGPDRGLFFFSPILLLCIPGFYYMLRDPEWRKEAIVFLVIILVLTLFVGGMSNWPGGWAFGPRYLAPILPFMITAVFVSLVQKPFRTGRLLHSLVCLLGLLSVLIITIGTITFPYPAPEMNDPFFILSLPLFFRGDFSRNIVSSFGLVSFGTALLFYTFLAITLLVMLDITEKVQLNTKSILFWLGVSLATIGYLTFGYSTAKPTPFDFYARASASVYLGDYYHAGIDLTEALNRNPDDHLKRLISLRYQQAVSLGSRRRE
jgi:hypothetical protein